MFEDTHLIEKGLLEWTIEAGSYTYGRSGHRIAQKREDEASEHVAWVLTGRRYGQKATPFR